MTTTRRRARYAAVVLTAALTLAACAPVASGGGGMGSGGMGGMGGGMGSGGMGGMGSGGMGSGGMGSGGMGSGGMGSGSQVGEADATEEHGESQASEPIPGAREITVEAGDLYFEPDTIRIEAGEPVNLTVTNVGDAFHDFTIAALDVMIDVPAGTTATGGLTVAEPGSYTYECTVPGHAAAGMTGMLVVSRGEP